MAEPSPDDIDLDACFEEVDGVAMPMPGSGLFRVKWTSSRLAAV